MVMRPGVVSITVSGLTRRLLSARPMVKGFMVEPGSKVSVSARLRSCSPVSLPRLAGVVAGVVGQGQHLAGVGVQHHHAAGLGLVLGHGVAQLLVGKELHLAVDGQLHVAPIDGRHLGAHALDHAAQAVLDDAARAGLAGQLLVEGQLHALLAMVFHVGEAHHMGGGLALGVLALVFLALVDALDAQGGNLLAHVPVELALDPDEGLVFVGQLGHEVGQRHVQQARQLLELLARTSGLSRSTSSGMAQMLAAGTLDARIRPLRSRMRPRLAGSSSVRAKRTSPWRWKKALPNTCT